METRSVGVLAVAAIGSGMILLFLLAGITVAVNHSVPTEYWAAAGGLSGAMVGLLAPQPATKGALTRQAARLMASSPEGGEPGPPERVEPRVAATVGAGGVPGPPHVDISDRPAGGPQMSAYVARTERLDAINRAVAGASSYDLRVIGLLVVGMAAFVAGIWLALTVGDHVPATAYDTAVSNASTALIALGSAAGGALVGLLAPTPGQNPSPSG